jgi:PAS domain S-box-containing protein
MSSREHWGPLGSRLIVLAVLLGGLALTWSLVRYARAAQAAEAQARFDGYVDRVVAEVQRRMYRAQAGLKGIRGAYAVLQRKLDPTEFRDYVAARNLAQDFPGIRGFGFIERVPRAELSSFIQAQARSGMPDFQLRTSGQAPDLLVISRIEPLAANRGALGLDIGSDRARRDAAERAIQTGADALTAPVALVQDNLRRPGWLVFVPVFQRAVAAAAAPGNPAAAAAVAQPGRPSERLMGLLYAPIVAAEVLADAKDSLEGQVDFQLIDARGDRLQMLFDSMVPGSPQPMDGAADRYHSRRLFAREELTLGGRPLTLRIYSTPALEAASEGIAPVAAGAAGVLLSILLALSTWLLLSARERAMRLAQRMTADLRRLGQVVQRTTNAVFGTDLDLRINWINEGFTRISGYSAAEAVGRTPGELLRHPLTDPAVIAQLGDAAARRESVRVELLNRRKDGSDYWVETEIQPMHDALGRVDGFMEISLDITERKAAEARLQASEHLMRVVTDNMPGRVAYWDRELRCRFLNRMSVEHFGIDARQVLGRTVTEVFGPERYAVIADRVEAALRGETQRFERKERDADGGERTVLVHYIPDTHEDVVHGFFVLVLDVTELYAARDMALQASQAKSRFLATMSHEIRTPMNAILGMLALLQTTALTARQSDYVHKIDGAARSLLGLINDILDFSKVEAGKMALDPHPFSMDTVLRDLSVILSASIGTRNIEVLFDVDPALPPRLIGDDLRLGQVLINLAGNAIKFTTEGEVVVRVRMAGLQGQDCTVAIAVEDTGIGMAPEHLRELFQDFAQAESSTARRFGGTGLGLAICQRLVGLMGGELQVRSELGKGTVFSFEVVLPVAQEADAAEVPVARCVERVLVVDDNPVARELLSHMARSLGWQVDLAASGQEALARLPGMARDGTFYDAIFLDWKMPDMDGWQTASRLREHPVGQVAVLVMVSAHGRDMLAGRGVEERALIDSFVVKPVTASMLADALSEARGLGRGSGHAGPFGRLGPGAGAAGPAAAETDRAAGAAHHPASGAALDGEPVLPLQGYRLLVAEDNANNQQVALELLSAQGAMVELASDGVEAVAQVASAEPPFDGVLMDIQMPVMDGFEATRQIRALPRGVRLPIIAMTAGALPEDEAECLAAGMNGHVGKPFDIRDLVKVLLHHLRAGSRGPGAVPAGGPQPSAKQASAGAAPPGDRPPAGTPASPAPGEPALIDVAAAIARMGGDPALYRMLVPTFSADIAAMAARMGPLLASGALDEARRVLHTMKGLAATMGANAVSERAAALEKRLLGGNPDAGPMPALEALVRETLAAQQEALERL